MEEKKDEPLISIVMPNYNGSLFVAKAINSVLKQSYKNWELIVVDDSSTDNSPALIQEFVKNDLRIALVFMEKNSGVSSVRNTGIQLAKGKYIALIDNDDTWESDKLERQLRIAEEGAELVYCSYDLINESDQPIKKAFIVPETASYQSMLTSSVISCSTAFVRADVLKKHPFSSNYYHEDYVLWMELLKLPISAKGDKKVLMHYRQISDSRSHKKSRAAKERWLVYRKALGLSVFQSATAFFKYALKGVFKYYF